MHVQTEMKSEYRTCKQASIQRCYYSITYDYIKLSHTKLHHIDYVYIINEYSFIINFSMIPVTSQYKEYRICLCSLICMWEKFCTSITSLFYQIHTGFFKKRTKTKQILFAFEEAFNSCGHDS